jgi:hypothetical protein
MILDIALPYAKYILTCRGKVAEKYLVGEMKTYNYECIINQYYSK